MVNKGLALSVNPSPPPPLGSDRSQKGGRTRGGAVLAQLSLLSFSNRMLSAARWVDATSEEGERELGGKGGGAGT